MGPDNFAEAPILYPQSDELPPGWYLKLKAEDIYTNLDSLELSYHPNSWKD